jgi:hypothetical protein
MFNEQAASGLLAVGGSKWLLIAVVGGVDCNGPWPSCMWLHY